MPWQSVAISKGILNSSSWMSQIIHKILFRLSTRTSILEHCSHPIVMKDLCGVCGADLQKLGPQNLSGEVAMVHNIPELRVSMEVRIEIDFISLCYSL